MFIDTHAHLFDEKIERLKLDLSTILKVLIPTYKIEHFDKVKRFCSYDEKFCLAVGVHPQYIDTFDFEYFQNFVKTNLSNIYAIGEIGLDSAYPSFDRQKEVFIQQVKVASKYNLPISVHLRGNVFDDFFEIMAQFPEVKCALHCFCGGKSELERASKRGYYISFACNITYKRNVALRKLVSLVPPHLLLIETDSPSMAPSGFGRGAVNTSANVHFVAETLAKELNCSVEKIAKLTTQNAIKLFHLGSKV